MGITDLLGSTADTAAGGVRTMGEGGVLLFDVPALTAALRDRCAHVDKVHQPLHITIDGCIGICLGTAAPFCGDIAEVCGIVSLHLQCAAASSAVGPATGMHLMPQQMFLTNGIAS